MIAIIGGGPAGLMTAELLSRAAVSPPLQIHVYDKMPSFGRKFLLAGRGGLNLTHSEPIEPFLARYGDRRPLIEPWLRAFGPAEVRQWADELGAETFIGTSGRVFPKAMKASPLLRAWLQRLQANGVIFHPRHAWQRWDADGALLFDAPDGRHAITPNATVLALGGGSWARLGSDGAWVPWLVAKGVPVRPLQPANCGFEVAWSDYFRGRFAGEPLKSVALTFGSFQRQGELVISDYGVEGSLVYAVSAAVRDALSAEGTAVIHLDLIPHQSEAELAQKLARPRGSRSLASHLSSRLNLKGVKFALLRECLPPAVLDDPLQLAAAIKALPVALVAPRPLDEAISSAGGVAFESLTPHLMVRDTPGLFCAGEMLDWEAPTGGYLLTACMASGRIAAQGVLEWLLVNGYSLLNNQ
ncbi:MAG: TIGR03862 family flavoprotein [Chloroflexi bacterium]|nr:TIGR03862 family flavoprotein [Chloroflexota bacterium]